MFSFDDRRALAGLDLALLDHRGTVSIVRFADGHTGPHGPHPTPMRVSSAFAAGMASPMLAANPLEKQPAPHQCGDKLRVPGD